MNPKPKSPKDKNLSNDTRLHMAVFFDRADMVKSLLKYGAEINIVNALGDTALDDAVILGRHEIAQLLLTNGAPPNPNNTHSNIA